MVSLEAQYYFSGEILQGQTGAPAMGLTASLDHAVAAVKVLGPVTSIPFLTCYISFFTLNALG